MQLAKAYKAKTSFSQLLLTESAMCMLKFNSVDITRYIFIRDDNTGSDSGDCPK